LFISLRGSEAPGFAFDSRLTRQPPLRGVRRSPHSISNK